MRKYITIPYEDYTKLNSDIVGVKKLTTTGLTPDDSTVVTSFPNGEVDGHGHLSADSPSSGSTAAHHRLPPSSHPDVPNSSRDPDPVHHDRNNTASRLDIPPQLYAVPPTSSAADIPHLEQNTPDYHPKVRDGLPNPSLAVSTPVVSHRNSSLNNPSPVNSKKKKKRDPANLSHRDSLHSMSEKSASQGGAGLEKPQQLKYDNALSSVVEQNADHGHSFHVQRNTSPKEGLKFEQGEKTKSDHSSTEGCSSSSYISSPAQNLEQLKHPGNIYQASEDHLQDLGEPSSPEVFVEGSLNGQIHHQSHSDTPRNYAELSSGEQHSADPNQEYKQSKDWSGLWNVKDVSKVLSLKRKAEEDDVNMEEGNSSPFPHGVKNGVVNVSAMHKMHDRKNVVLDDGEKSLAEPQRPLPNHTPSVTPEPSRLVDPSPHPEHHSLPPPGIPSEKIEKKSQLPTMSHVDDTKGTIQHDHTPHIAQKILKQKNQSNSVITRHNTRPKRSKAGAALETWKLGWTP